MSVYKTFIRIGAISSLIICFTETEFCAHNFKSRSNFYPDLSHNFAVSKTFSSDSAILKNNFPGLSEKTDYGRLALISGTLLGSMIAIHVYQQNGWWKDNRAAFHFREDLVYGLSVDKIGHFYGTSALAYVVSKSLEWANISEEKSLLWGSAAGLLFQTYVEVEDGFSEWGFDRVDFASDVGGAAWPIAKYYIPELRAVDLKLSYKSSPLLGSSQGIGFKGQKHLIIDDYEGQNFWLSFKINDILPESAGKYWPDFLCIALGYGARDVGSKDPFPVWFLSFDYDMTEIIPGSTPFLKTLGQVLNFVHFPAPAVRFHPSAIWYGVYF